MTKLHVTTDQLRELVAREVDRDAALLGGMPNTEYVVPALRRRATAIREGREDVGLAHLTPELAVPAVYAFSTYSSRFLDLIRVATRDGEDVPLFRVPRWCSTWVAEQVGDRLLRLLAGLDLVEDHSNLGHPALSPDAVAAVQQAVDRMNERLHTEKPSGFWQTTWERGQPTKRRWVPVAPVAVDHRWPAPVSRLHNDDARPTR